MNALAILSRRFAPIEAGLTASRPCENCSPPLVGVYLLVARDQIVYVGRSGNVSGRLHGHICKNTRYIRAGIHDLVKVFDRALWLCLPSTVLGEYERTLIRFLRPKYNASTHPEQFHEKEILFGLGLIPELKIDPDDMAYWEVVA